MALTGCGEAPQTNRINTIGPGVNERDASVDVLGLRILSDSHHEGRVIGALVNNVDSPATLHRVFDESGDITVEMNPVRVPPEGHVNLAVDVVLRARGDFSAGDFVDLTFSFSTGEIVTVGTPVVKQCSFYDDVALPADDPRDENTAGDTYLCVWERDETTSRPPQP